MNTNGPFCYVTEREIFIAKTFKLHRQTLFLLVFIKYSPNRHYT